MDGNGLFIAMATSCETQFIVFTRTLLVVANFSSGHTLNNSEMSICFYRSLYQTAKCQLEISRSTAQLLLES